MLKKGMAANVLVTIIAVILSFMVISFWLFPAVANAQGKQAEKICRSSVALRQGTAINVGPVEIKSGPLLCKTLSPKIKGDKKDIQKQLEEKIKTCWDMFGSGTYRNDVFDNTNVFGGGKNCFTCYTLPIESTRKFKTGEDSISPEELWKSMRESKTLNYVQTGRGKGSLLALLTKEGIQPDGLYAISYKPGLGECDGCGLIAGAPAVIGGVLLFTPAAPLGAILLTSSITLTGGGVLAAGYTAKNLVTNDILDQVEHDTIFLTDISKPEMANVLKQKCNFVKGVDEK